MSCFDRKFSCSWLALVLAARALTACAAPSDLPDDELAVHEAPIIAGQRSSAAQDAVVMLRIAEQALCTGTLVADNLVLTARHCVSETEPSISCAPDGTALAGGRVGADHEPEDIVVYTGSQRTKLVARARGAQIVHDHARNLCNHDLAFVVLDRAVSGAPVAPLRLTETTRVGEEVTAVGWGLTAKSTLPTARMQRKHVRIVDVGPSPRTASHHLVVGEAICSGDSGGPALAASGAIVGVVSHGGNGTYDPAHPAASCRGASATNVYTRIAPFASLVRQAFSEAGAKPKLEAPAH